MTMTGRTGVRTDGVPPGGGGGAHRRRWWYVVAVLAAAVLILGIVVLIGEDDDVVSGGPATSAAPGTTVDPNDATGGPGTTTGTVAPPAVDRSVAIWPAGGTAERFTDPVAAARAFATGFLGFEAPVVGQLQRGDSRSGEVEVRPQPDGPVTLVTLRQLGGEDTWSVLGASSRNIEVTEPAAGAEVRSPVPVRGSAHAFEGNVVVEVREDGNPGPLGRGVVTGGGDQMRPFDGRIGFDPPTQRLGALVFVIPSARDGQVWEASAMRVRLTGGDAEPAACNAFEPGRPALRRDEMEVTVYFGCDTGSREESTIPVHRAVPRSTGVLRAAIGALLEGPTAEEARAGISSWFSSETAGMLRGVSLTGGHAVVDVGDLRTVIPNASTSAGSAVLLRQLDATVFQFRSVESVEYRIDGSCEVFNEWLQLGGCDPRTRS